jgi:hypothetical protein
MGASEMLVCRNPDKGRAAIEYTPRKTGSSELDLRIADISSRQRYERSQERYRAAGEGDYRHRIDLVGSQRDFNGSVTTFTGAYAALRRHMTGVLCGAKSTAAGVCGAPAFCNREVIRHG